MHTSPISRKFLAPDRAAGGGFRRCVTIGIDEGVRRYFARVPVPGACQLVITIS